MKALHTLTGAEKARLLHELFPDEIPTLLEAIEEFCADFKASKEEYREHWKEGFMPFEYWQGLAEETAGLLKKYKFNMKRSSRVFSDQLYYTYTSLFVTDRIVKYAEASDNAKFKLIVQAFFN